LSKRILRISTVGFGLIAMAFFGLVHSGGPPLSEGTGTSGRWTQARALQWSKAQPWLVGCNFIPSTAINTLEMWQAATFDPGTIDRELGWAEQLGFNSVRVFLHNLPWEQDSRGFLDRLDKFLTIASSHRIRPMFVMLDACWDPSARLGPQRAPTPHVHNSGWVQCPDIEILKDRAKHATLKGYIQGVIRRFRGDERVLAWDLYNEPDIQNGKPYSDREPADKLDLTRDLLEKAFVWAREVSPSQPLTSAPAQADNPAGELPAATRLALAESDVISFHDYGDLASLRTLVDALAPLGRPLLCTEYLARTSKSRLQTHLPFFKEAGIGAWNWGLVSGKTQTIYPWDSWEKKYTVEPQVWFHDILRPDGSEFDPAEVDFLRAVTGAPGVRTLKPLFNFPVRDTCVCLGPDRTVYLIGTTGAPTWWETNDGIRIWKSRDLKKWEPLGLVWSFEKDGTWQKGKDAKGHRALWAPELHYLKNTYWITYCINYKRDSEKTFGGTGILRSISGKAEGPYVDIKPSGPLTLEIDASLFQDDDGKVYFVYQNGKIARMKDDMTGLADAPRLLKPANAPQVGFEGAFLFKAKGRYRLSCAEFINDQYHCYVASSEKLMGPYGNRYLAVPHGGHNMFFRDGDGQWWSTIFGNDDFSPFRERPGILRVEFGTDGSLRPCRDQ
jgi:hypothetical protein